jgi:hypothetical protein
MERHLPRLEDCSRERSWKAAPELASPNLASFAVFAYGVNSVTQRNKHL